MSKQLSHSDSIAQAIEESRKREQNGRGPCGCESEDVCHCETKYDLGLETWEPRFREALAVAVESLSRIQEDALQVGLKLYVHATARTSLVRIEAILAGSSEGVKK